MPVILKNFNRQHTIIRLPQFGAPKLSKLTELELPRGSILHYQPTAVSEVGPSQRLPILEKAEKLIAINHVVDLATENMLGKPILNPDFNTHIQRDIMAYHRANKRMRRMREKSLIERDPRTLLVENYAMLPGRFRYRETLMSWYERWHNIYETIFQQMASDADAYDRQNYFFLNIPDTLPAIAMLKRAETSRTPSTLKTLRDDNVLIFLELWTWLGQNRTASMLGRFTNDQLKRINITLIYRDRFVNMNLGEVNFWRKDKNSPGLVNPVQMQRRFYKTAIELITRAAVVMPSEVSEAPVDEISDAETLPAMSARSEDALAAEDTDDAPVADDVASVSSAAEEQVDDNDDNVEIATDDAESIEADIQRYESLELDEDADFTVVQQTTVADNVEAVPDIDVPVTVENGIELACESYISAGTLSVREYNRITELGKKYQTIPNPYGGEGTLADILHVDPVELKLEREVLFDDITVFDKEMFKTITPKFDRQYIENVLPKDTVSSVVSIQRAGIAVTDYSVENIVDAVNSVQEHTVRVSPVNGAPATLRFTIPLIDKDGYWKANDVSYTMHKQRIDLPIRKTDPDTVALTTFYGKNFVQRSEKVVNNRPLWLTNHIAKRGIDMKDTSITQVMFADVFTPEVKLPRDYTSIAMRISSFEAGGIVYNFDYKNRHEHFSPEDIKEFDGKELVPVGKGAGAVYAMDMYSNIYRKKGKDLTEVGTISEVLNLPLDKEPKEYTELSMMGKAIPLAFIFSYYLGLEKMLKLFKIPYRFVEPNERISPTFDEIVVKMSDAKLIITPDTAEHRLLVNGLTPYLKLTRSYTRRDFNSQDVYLNLLAKDGLNARYLTELDLMRTMYVDPISERLLKDMGEPVTFMGLLRRSNEMLVLDNAPPETDMDEMHLFGKQRIAGAVYTSMVRAIREYQNKPGSRKQLDLHSTAVWSAITQDGSVAPASNANPIHHIKQQDVITYSGTGGRSKRSMVKRTRKYHKSELGVISGDTVDSSDVAVTSYLAADPQLENVDGVVKKDRATENFPAAQVLSNCVLLAPFTLYDKFVAHTSDCVWKTL